MREFLKWLRFGFSIRTFGAILLVFILLLCIWAPGIILVTRFRAYVSGVPVPDLTTMLFPLGWLSAVLMILYFGAFSIYLVYARDTKWDKDNGAPQEEEDQ